MYNLLYNRFWRITILPTEGDPIVVSDSSYGEGALHCVFEVRHSYEARTYGRIRIYNLKTDTIKMFTEQAVSVTIEAGYQDCYYGKPAVIWDANVYHFIEYRENVVDRVLDIYTTNTPKEVLTTNFLMANITEGQTVNGIFEHVAKQYKMQTRSSNTLRYNTATTTRPHVSFGLYDREMHILEKSCTAMSSLCCDGSGNISIADIFNIETTSNTDIIAISPESGLIGLPNQVPQGVSFKTLLDPRLKWTAPIPTMIQFKNSEIKGLANYVGVYPALPLDDNGVYKIISVVHRGDTRGEDWFSEVETISDLSKLAKRPE